MRSRSALAIALVGLVGCSAPRAQSDGAATGDSKSPPDIAQARPQSSPGRPDISPRDAERLLPPLPPLGLQVVKAGNKAMLSWEPSLYRSVNAYAVYRKVGSGKYEKLAVIDEPQFVDTKTPKGAVWYSVAARTASGLESPLSEPVVTKPLPKASSKK